MSNILQQKYEERAEWFKERIGKRVYRNKNGCSCKPCAKVYVNGLVIADSMHGSYMHDCEAEHTAEGDPMRYFDTIKERDKYELEIAKS